MMYVTRYVCSMAWWCRAYYDTLTTAPTSGTTSAQYSYETFIEDVKLEVGTAFHCCVPSYTYYTAHNIITDSL